MNNPTSTQTRRRLTGYCGWKIWKNNSSGKTCDQIAVELAFANSDNGSRLQIAEAKSEILEDGCVCGDGEKSFDEDIITPSAFCGLCRYRDASFSCNDRVDFVVEKYPETNPTIKAAQMNILRRGDCFDRNWAPYAQRMQFNGDGEGLTGGAIAGIVIATLALCGAGMAACCLLKDMKRVKLDQANGDEIHGKESSTKNAKPKLNVIEEGDEDEDEESEMGAEMSVVASSEAPQSNTGGSIMSDAQTEIVTNRGKK